MNSINNRIVFINGILPRSGTHFLANLLCQHPDCIKAPVPEDGFLASGKHLANYVDSLVNSWTEQNNSKDYNHYKDTLLEGFGLSLSGFLWNATRSKTEGKTTMVAKTPLVNNLKLFPKLFPSAKLIILVRDGRDLVESAVRSFNYDRNETIINWVKATETIKKYTESVTEDKYLIVRYEDLHENVEMEMKRILMYLDLEIEKYNFDAAADLPVVGSSVFKRGDGNVHWWPVSKNETFQPLERTKEWTKEDHDHFNAIAGESLLYWGYEPETIISTE